MASLRATITPQEVHITSDLATPPSYHIFFITGNPGCIGYYHSYLTILAEHVSKYQIDVYGHSLANFVDDPAKASSTSKQKQKTRILGLQGQVEYVEDILGTYCNEQVLMTRSCRGGSLPRIILVGHSVGAYIGLEILRRWRERGKKGVEKRSMEIVGYVGLWPTITWIGRSLSGRRVGWLARIPYLPKLVGAVVKTLNIALSECMLKRLVKLITKMPDDAAEITTEFLRSRRGVEQALHMARDEMLEITEDRWDEGVWGTTSPIQDGASSKLIFYFGKRDHWVADYTRDELIASRANLKGSENEQWKPKMLIDDEGIPHGFCIRHSSMTVGKTENFVKEIMETDQRQQRNKPGLVL